MEAFLLLQDDHVLGGDILLVQDHVQCQLLATKADHHQLTAEIRVLGDVAHVTFGNIAVGGIDGDTTPIRMVQRDDVIHVRILRKKFLLHLPHRHIQHPLDTLHGGGDSQDVAAPGVLAARDLVAKPRGAWRLGQVRDDMGTPLQMVKSRRLRDLDHVLVDPGTSLHVTVQGAESHPVAYDILSLLHVPQRDLVRLGNRVLRDKAPTEILPFGQGLNRNRNIVLFGNLNVFQHWYSLFDRLC